jgi:ketosteroid isomerase-like protein
MHHCIVDGADIAAVWTCQTAEDFEFHHNVITRSQYVWMRSPGNKKVYRLRDCVITDSKYASGTGTASAIHGPTGADITFNEENVVKRGTVQLVIPGLSPRGLTAERPRDYLHVTPGTLGSDLGAGLFSIPSASSDPPSTDPVTSQEHEAKVKDEVWETVRSVNRAWLGYDMEALSGLCHPDVVIVAPGFGRRSVGRQATMSSYEGFISMATVKHFTESDPTIDLCDDTAVVTYRIEIAADVDGQPYAEQGRELHVLRRSDDRWLSIWRMVVPEDR